MDYPELEKIKSVTRKAIHAIPETIEILKRASLEMVTNRDIFVVNSLAVLTGIIAGYAAILFRGLIGFFQNSIFHNRFGLELASPLDHSRGLWVIIIPPIGLLIVSYIVKWYASEAKGHGVPEVIEAVLTRQGRIRKRIVAIKAFVSSLTIATGGSVGREGPIVQIGSAAGSSLGQMFHLKPKLLKTLVGCGAAGAVAATFNTPIAGVIFAIEIIVLELKTKSFIPLVVSSVFATVISRVHLGNEPAFFVPTYSFGNPAELIFYLGLGIISGFIGILMIKALYGMEDLFEKAPLPFFAKPILGGLILGTLGYFYPQIFGVGYETVSMVLQQTSTIEIMAVLIFLKIFAVSLTMAAGGSGGVFAPSLFVGAMVGGTYGWIANQLFPSIVSGYGAYALVGMAAMFSATCRAAFTSIVILFEMTLDYSIILPLMFVCVVADQTAWALSKETMYSLKLTRKGLKFVNDIGLNIMSVTLIKDIMSTDLVTFSRNCTLADVLKAYHENSHSIYPVINESQTLAGVVRSEEISEAVNEKGGDCPIEEFVKPATSLVYPTDTVQSALNKFDMARDPRILVIERLSGKLIGIVSPVDFVRLSCKEEND
jgi:CIC family chloride channel protein